MTRMYGTTNRKGIEVDTPYWVSGLVSAPEEITPVSLEALQSVAALVPDRGELAREKRIP
jgi:hypothetical protein